MPHQSSLFQSAALSLEGSHARVAYRHPDANGQGDGIKSDVLTSGDCPDYSRRLGGEHGVQVQVLVTEGSCRSWLMLARSIWRKVRLLQLMA